MFPKSDRPRVFGLPPGVDFPSAVVAGIEQRLTDTAPETWADVTILANTRRLQRRLQAVLSQGPARLLPRLRLITDLAFDPVAADLPPPEPALRRKLELSRLVGSLIAAQGRIPPSARFDLTDSLLRLLTEMSGEGVSFADIEMLDVSDQSGHWAEALQFIKVVAPFIDEGRDTPDPEFRQRLVVERLAEIWAKAPPEHPILVVGSTGSRGTTARLLEVVAGLPQGAVILPGFDFDQPEAVWRDLDDALSCEDHPQFRFARLMSRLGLAPTDIIPWHDTHASNPARNRLISLALRPAPVTDQWMQEGPALTDLPVALADVTLVEAKSPRAEAEAIALRLRQAAERQETAILITPDRSLTRRVEAALDRWGLVPDDSAGTPLGQTPPGRLLRQVANAMAAQVTSADLLAMLKHPLVGGADRGPHLRWTRELELSVRRYGPAFPTAAALETWAAKREEPGLLDWATWIGGIIAELNAATEGPLADLAQRHKAAAETLAVGSRATGSGALWEEKAGRKAYSVMARLWSEAEAGGTVTPTDFARLVTNVISGEEVRDRDAGHPNILFRGTLEARVQSADLVILGGLNDGIWPPAPGADPWLNRALRARVGLLLPERQIGLSAHDFQQAVAAKEVWITRPIRSDDAETVPSRWVNRLVNLVTGLDGGAALLSEARARGDKWLAHSTSIEVPTETVASSPRPAPRPPVGKRPRELSVTDIRNLIRDPYAVYARRVLGLRPLDPLTPSADAAMRGTILHAALEAAIKPGEEIPDRDGLLRIAAEVLERECPWPGIRSLWLGRLARIADWFLDTEALRREVALPAEVEAWGEVVIEALGIRIKAKADRIDVTPDGAAVIYDYKTGTPPSEKAQLHFDKQLMIEAAMLERGGFADTLPRRVHAAGYIGLGSTPKEVPAPLDKETPGQIWEGLITLLTRWQVRSRGYSARMASERSSYPGDYDHLSRRGEWDDSDPFKPEDVG
jgi:double-strand break repair protein AddB